MPPHPHRDRPHRRRAARRHLYALPTPDPDPPPTPGELVFSPGRLRGYRDLRGLDRRQLAKAAGTTPVVIVAYEEATAQPDPNDLRALADALTVEPGALCGRADADDSWEYWSVRCAHLPPMTDEQIATVATVLRRIDQQRHHGHDQQPPQAA